MKRKFVSITHEKTSLLAIADDGTAWYIELPFDGTGWQQIPNLPDQEEPNF